MTDIFIDENYHGEADCLDSFLIWRTDYLDRCIEKFPKQIKLKPKKLLGSRIESPLDTMYPLNIDVCNKLAFLNERDSDIIQEYCSERLKVLLPYGRQVDMEYVREIQNKILNELISMFYYS